MRYPHLDWLTAKENSKCQGAAEGVRLDLCARNCVGTHPVPDFLGFRGEREMDERIRSTVERNYVKCARIGLLGLIRQHGWYLKLDRRSIRNCDERPWVWGDSTGEMRSRFQRSAERHRREMIRLAALARKLAPKQHRTAPSRRGAA